METTIESLMPHRGLMRLLDRLVTVDDDHAVAEVDVPADGLFVQDGEVPAWVGIEYMAQTVSVWAGARAQRRGGAPRIGLLLGSRRYEAHRSGFPSGATLRIETRCEMMGAKALRMFDCRTLLRTDAV